MHFLDKRIQVICDQLNKLRVKQNQILNTWEYKKGNFIHPEDAYAGETDFEPFDSLTMHWYGPEHYWFKTELTVPESFAGKPLWLHIRTQIDEWDDAKNPQFLIFVDGTPWQGVDMNHRYVLLTEEAEAGRVYALDLQAYTGTLHTEFNFLVDVCEIDREIEGLYYDLQVPLQAFPRLGQENPSRWELERVMNEGINLLDLREPYSENFYRSVHEARRFLAKALYEDLAGHSEVIATCIGHTHIDVAWWWTVAQTEEKVARSFATVLKFMEEYPNYLFMSSQAQLYAFLKQRYPELYEQVKERVREGRWEIEGGMWVEADCNLTSGESLLRQFLYGKKFFKDEFDIDCKMLWLPDVFGYTAALPGIMAACDIEYFMTTKLAWNQFNKMPYDTFMWEGIDGSQILTHLITTLGVEQSEENFFTTYNGILHPDALIGAWKRYQQKQLNNDVLISYGYGDGGGGPTRPMLETSKRLEHGITGIPKVRQAFAGQYFEELDERVRGHKRLPTWVGELYFEYHRGTLTSMARNKRSNRKSEFALMNVELLSVLTQERVDYPKEELDRLWRLVMINQFHDILPGTSIKEVYEVTAEEYQDVKTSTTQLIEARLAELTSDTEEHITLLNPTGYNHSDIIQLGELDAEAIEDQDGKRYLVQKTSDGAVSYVENLPAKGFQSFKLIRENSDSATTSPMRIQERGIETPYYIVEFDEEGLLTRLYDKENQREVLAVGEKGNLMRMYEDKPIYYDNWDIDIFYTEKFWDATGLERIEWTEEGPVRATLELERKISQSTILQKIHFYAKSRRIDFETTVDWKEHQHLLKVHFPTNIHSDEASFDIQFGTIKRKTHKNTTWDVARFESCGQKWMDFSEGHYGLSLLNDCKYGHSVDGSTIALTLIKSGIEPNPETDQEMHYFTYALWPHAGDWKTGRTMEEGYKLNHPVLTVLGQAKETFSLGQVDQNNVVLETIKRAEDGNGIIVRLYESENALTPTTLTWNLPFSRVESCNALEKPLEDSTVQIEDNGMHFTMKPHEIKTLRIYP